MLPKKNRYSFLKGLPKNTIAGPLFTLRYEKNNSTDVRAAIVVSKKVSLSAVVRNRAKRRITEVLRNTLPEGFNLVFLLKKAIVDTDQKSLKTEVNNIFKTIHGNR